MLALEGKANPLTSDMIEEYTIAQSESWDSPMRTNIRNLLMAQSSSPLLQEFVSIYRKENGLTNMSEDELRMMTEPNYLAAAIRHNENLYRDAMDVYLENESDYNVWIDELMEDYFPGDE